MLQPRKGKNAGLLEIREKEGFRFLSFYLNELTEFKITSGSY